MMVMSCKAAGIAMTLMSACLLISATYLQVPLAGTWKAPIPVSALLVLDLMQVDGNVLVSEDSRTSHFYYLFQIYSSKQI